jgi:hypothetical protein
MCTSDINLIVADLVLKVMFKELEKQNNKFSEKLIGEIKLKIVERRTVWSDILQFLHNWRIIEPENFFEMGIFNRLTLEEIKNHIVNKIVKIVKIEEKIMKKESAKKDPTICSEESGEELSFNEKVNRLYKKSYLQNNDKNNRGENFSKEDLIQSVKNEISLYCKTGVRGNYLSLLYQYLLTIKPTSVESERVFSASGLLCTKIRSRMSDATIDILSFLKSYFLKNNKREKNIK